MPQSLRLGEYWLEPGTSLSYLPLRTAVASGLLPSHRLKKLVVDLSLDKEMLKAVISKKRTGLGNLREEVSWLVELARKKPRSG